MDVGIDSGPIVDVRYFDVQPADDVASVLSRTYDYMLCQLYDVANAVARGNRPEPLPVTWARKATRKRDMDRLREVTPDTPAAELEKRIRATSFGRYRPYLLLHGRRFILEE
jgi:methionyl-tRNA formyltransferase